MKYPPSIQAIIEYRTNENRGFDKILKTYVLRSAMLGLGFYFLSDKKTALKNGLIGSAIIESYLLYFFTKEKAEFYKKKMLAREAELSPSVKEENSIHPAMIQPC